MSNETPANQSAKQNPTLKIFGIGSAGVAILDQMAREGTATEALVAIHSDASAISACAAAQKLHINTKAAGSSNGPVENSGSDEIIPPPSTRFSSLFDGVDIALVVVGMGGAFGTRLGPVLARAGRQAGAVVLAVAILPYECEGSQRSELAEEGLKQFRDAADLVICWPNQKTFELITPGTGLMDIFRASNRFLATALRGAERAFASKAVIGVGFLELCRSIRNGSNTCLFAVSEASGADRAAKAGELVLAHPMLVADEGLQNASTISVCILGGPSLAMAEVNQIMDHLQRKWETASLAMGAAIATELGETLLLAVLLAPSDEADAQSQTEQDAAAGLAPRGKASETSMQLLQNDANTRRSSRFLPPPPSLPPEKMQQLLKQQGRGHGRGRKGQASFRQTQLPLEILSKGRFDKSEPTIHKGEDLDVPTYIRRGVALN